MGGKPVRVDTGLIVVDDCDDDVSAATRSSTSPTPPTHRTTDTPLTPYSFLPARAVPSATVTRSP